MKIINMDFSILTICFFSAAGVCSVLLSRIGSGQFFTIKKRIRSKQIREKQLHQEQDYEKQIHEERIHEKQKHEKQIHEEQIHKKCIYIEIILWMFAGIFSIMGILCSLIGGMKLENLMLPLLGLLWINLFSQIKIGRKKLRGNE